MSTSSSRAALLSLAAFSSNSNSVTLVVSLAPEGGASVDMLHGRGEDVLVMNVDSPEGGADVDVPKEEADVDGGGEDMDVSGREAGVDIPEREEEGGC